MSVQGTVPVVPAQGRGFRAYSAKHLDQLTARAGLGAAERLAVRAVATVLPFRTNDYVLESLIDWSAAPDDPIYRLVFPQADMLPAEDIAPIAALLDGGAPEREIQAAAHGVRMRLNPHPAGQLALNVPALSDEPLPGVQHKYPETVLVFPKQGQTCHAYCTYCFRWAQFVGEPDLKMATDDMSRVTCYLRAHREVTSVLMTGGDPMIMGSSRSAPLRRAAARPEPRPHRVDPDRNQVAGLLATAVPHRSGRRRHPPAVRRGRRGREDAGAHGPLLARPRARASSGVPRYQPDPEHRRCHPYAGPADQDH